MYMKRPPFLSNSIHETHNTNYQIDEENNIKGINNPFSSPELERGGNSKEFYEKSTEKKEQTERLYNSYLNNNLSSKKDHFSREYQPLHPPLDRDMNLQMEGSNFHVGTSFKSPNEKKKLEAKKLNPSEPLSLKKVMIKKKYRQKENEDQEQVRKSHTDYREVGDDSEILVQFLNNLSNGSETILQSKDFTNHQNLNSSSDNSAFIDGVVTKKIASPAYLLGERKKRPPNLFCHDIHTSPKELKEKRFNFNQRGSTKDVAEVINVNREQKEEEEFSQFLKSFMSNEDGSHHPKITHQSQGPSRINQNRSDKLKNQTKSKSSFGMGKTGNNDNVKLMENNPLEYNPINSNMMDLKNIDRLRNSVANFYTTKEDFQNKKSSFELSEKENKWRLSEERWNMFRASNIFHVDSVYLLNGVQSSLFGEYLKNDKEEEEANSKRIDQTNGLNQSFTHLEAQPSQSLGKVTLASLFDCPVSIKTDQGERFGRKYEVSVGTFMSYLQSNEDLHKFVPLYETLKDVLSIGSYFLKNTSSNKAHKRFIYVDAQTMTLSWSVSPPAHQISNTRNSHSIRTTSETNTTLNQKNKNSSSIRCIPFNDIVHIKLFEMNISDLKKFSIKCDTNNQSLIIYCAIVIETQKRSLELISDKGLPFCQQWFSGISLLSHYEQQNQQQNHRQQHHQQQQQQQKQEEEQ